MEIAIFCTFGGRRLKFPMLILEGMRRPEMCGDKKSFHRKSP